MKGDSPTQRASSASSEIRGLTQDINYHDARASELRKDREKAKAKLARAEKAIERAAASFAYANRQSEVGKP